MIFISKGKEQNLTTYIMHILSIRLISCFKSRIIEKSHFLMFVSTTWKLGLKMRLVDKEFRVLFKIAISNSLVLSFKSLKTHYS
jgi:hypothetical protein